MCFLTAIEDFDLRFDTLLKASSINQGEIRAALPDCFHFKRELNFHKSETCCQIRLDGDYGMFTFIESSKVVEGLID